MYSSAVVLRPYQETCITACKDALTAGDNRIGVSMPTGSGKTTVFISLLSQLAAPASNPAATRSLIIVNTIELARQSAEQIHKMFPSWKVEIEQGVKHHASGEADVTVATYQTLMRSKLRRDKFDPKFLKAIIVDEAHHSAAPSYRALLAHFDPAIKHPDKEFEPPILDHPISIIGFSATFSRHDGLALGAVFSRIVYHRDFLEMIKEEWLCDVRFTSVRTNLGLNSVSIGASGDFVANSLTEVLNTESINNVVVQSWMDKAATRKSTLVFCVGLAHVRDLTHAFRTFGVDARYLYAETPTAERKVLISDFKAGLFPVLVNCAILTEGADIPNIDCVVVARPTRSRNLFAQMIGRGMRQSPDTGKENCHIIDFVDSITRVAGVVSTPVLFGLDPNEDVVDDVPLKEIEKSSGMDAPRQQNIAPPSSVTYTDYANPFKIVDGASGAPHIASLSRYAWVGCGGEVYVLECMRKGYIRIEKGTQENSKEPIYRAWYTPAVMDFMMRAAFKASPRLRNRTILEALDLSAAVRGCDRYVTGTLFKKPIDEMLCRTANWRKTRATPSQRQYISKRWSASTEDDGLMAKRLKTLTKGEAANLITRFKHGAQTRWKQEQQRFLRSQQINSREQLRQERQHVKVGRLREH